MNNMIKYFIAVWLMLVSYSTTAAEAESIRHEIEVFLSTGIGSIVFFILLFLFLLWLLLWLLLPLAVFGIKSKLNQLTRENGETNRILSDIKETYKIRTENNESNEILAHINETNKILADIRDELSVLKEEESPTANAEQSKTTVYEENAGDLYDQIKYDP